jgi:hypothetical protein
MPRVLYCTPKHRTLSRFQRETGYSAIWECPGGMSGSASMKQSSSADIGPHNASSDGVANSAGSSGRLGQIDAIQ